MINHPVAQRQSDWVQNNDWHGTCAAVGSALGNRQVKGWEAQDLCSTIHVMKDSTTLAVPPLIRGT